MVVSDLDPNHGVHPPGEYCGFVRAGEDLSDLEHVNLLLVLTFSLVYTAVAKVAWTDLKDFDVAPFYLPSQ
eukprot:5666041-Prorocentrum_lima.AAC.1